MFLGCPVFTIISWLIDELPSCSTGPNVPESRDHQLSGWGRFDLTFAFSTPWFAKKFSFQVRFASASWASQLLFRTCSCVLLYFVSCFTADLWSVYFHVCEQLYFFSFYLTLVPKKLDTCFLPRTTLKKLYLLLAGGNRLRASTALRKNLEKVKLAQIIPYNIDTQLSTNQEIICLDLFSWTYPTTTLLKKISYFSFPQSCQNFLMISRSRQQHFRPL
jgi:hypothetical protein